MTIGKIKKIELRKIWKNEATDFTTWLEKNIDSLGEALDKDLTVVKREHQVGSFSVDILATDEDGRNVVIENQLEKTDHSHLGQIITYLSNLDGKIVIWISSEPRQEHINAVNWLNAQTDLEFFLVKLDAISIGDSEPAPLFQVICQPDASIKSAVAEENELTERGKFNLNFWAEVNKKCEGKLPGFLSRTPRKYHFHSQASGRGGFSFVFLATMRGFGVELYMNLPDADLNEAALNLLLKDRKAIEAEFGHKLEFQPLPEKRACRIRYWIKEGVDVMDVDRSAVQDELIDCMIQFEKVFKNRVRNLDLDSEQVA